MIKDLPPFRINASTPYIFLFYHINSLPFSTDKKSNVLFPISFDKLYNILQLLQYFPVPQQNLFVHLQLPRYHQYDMLLPEFHTTMTLN